MTSDKFRKLALSLPEVVEASHMEHPDFRVGGKIFASLGWPDEAYGMVKLTPKQQAEYVKAAPEMFQPVKGGWGRNGSTNVHLKSAKVEMVRTALYAAWCGRAPKRIVDEYLRADI